MNKNLLIIFAKNPELGAVKTRLAKTIGKAAALEIYIKLLEKTVSITENLELDKVVYYHEKIETDDLWDPKNFNKALQIGNDLGEKMNDAFHSAFNEGYKNVCIIGSDCFELTADIVNQAFTALNSKEAVIGAAEDGGYYLLGMSQYMPDFFENKAWSTDKVFSSTKKDFIKLGLSFTELTVLKDVDVEADLGDWAKTSNFEKFSD
jgi:rSAM/selenodomain-associated transferase 1